MIKIERLIQSDDKSCLPCVLGMMIGESEQYVKDWFSNQDPPLSDEDAIIFLAHHGVFLAIYCCVSNGETPLENFDGSEVRVEFDNRPAYVIVESERFPGKQHAVLWDGKRVLDPSPASAQIRALSEYKVFGFYPFMMTRRRLNMMGKL